MFYLSLYPLMSFNDRFGMNYQCQSLQWMLLEDSVRVVPLNTMCS